MSDQEILRLENIAKSFAHNVVLRDINFSLRVGEVHALVGENGAGKSTLVRIIAGAIKPDSGKLILEGNQIELDSPEDGIKAGIAVIYQELDLLPELTVIENLFLGIEPRNKFNLLDFKTMESIVDGILSEMNFHVDKFATVGTLPIASRQMVAIMKAIVHNAKILIMDEPSSSLTQKELQVLFDETRRLKKKNVSVIYISHRLEEIFQICDSVTVLRDGMLINTNQVQNITRKEIVEMMIGKKVDENRLNPRKHYDNRILLEVDDLSYNNILNSVSFNVKQGEIFGILGLLGSGTIELGKIIYGIYKPSSGMISINGKKVDFNSPADALKQSISYVPDERRELGLFMELDVVMNALITSLSKFLKNRLLNILDHHSLAKVFDIYGKRLGIKISGKEQKVQI